MSGSGAMRLGLMGRGRLQGSKLGWGELAVCGMGSVGVVVALQSSMITRASSSESNRHKSSSSSRNLPLNDSIQAFCPVSQDR